MFNRQRGRWRRVVFLMLRRKSGGRGGLAGRGFEGEKLLAKDRHVPRRLNTEADFAPVDVHDGNADIFPDENLFAKLSAQDEHVATLRRAKP